MENQGSNIVPQAEFTLRFEVITQSHHGYNRYKRVFPNPSKFITTIILPRGSFIGAAEKSSKLINNNLENMLIA
jgi:hypothetical protein